jgi:predicted porin
MTSKRNLISTALAVCGLAAAATTAQAQSSVTVYGIIGADVAHATNTGGAKTVMETSRLNPSRLGFKGSEDLGGGLSTVFDLETAINTDDGTTGMGRFWGRGAYVGFKSDSLGTLTFGRHWNINDDILGNFFIFGGYAVFNYTGFGFTSDLVNNSAKYVSPTFGGFTAEALVGAGEGTGPKMAEIAGSYAAGPVAFALTYHQAEYPGDLKNKLASAGASFGMDAWKVRAGYSHADNKIDDYSLVASSYKAQAYDVGVDYTVGAVGLSLDYVARDVKSSADDSHFIRLLATYALSKRTILNANLIQMKNKGVADEKFYGVAGAVTGKTQNIVAAGISHSF